MSKSRGLFLSFLYPCLFQGPYPTTRLSHRALPLLRTLVVSHCRGLSSPSKNSKDNASISPPSLAASPQVLYPLSSTSDDYGRSIFVDKCTLTIHAGNGGNGCVSFFRDTHTPDGPPNGGDGGSGGNVWIQAVKGHTSLHKLARRRIVKAGRGFSGRGGGQGGAKGDDALILVPTGTVVREVWRSDPSAEVEERERLKLGSGETVDFDPLHNRESAKLTEERERWVWYPGAKTAKDTQMAMPLPRPARRSYLAMMAAKAPIELDLSDEMETPTLLVAGAVGGLGNPHFATSEGPKPKFASKGEQGITLSLELELKLLADVGLVGLPNAGKSTLLRSITNSRTRVGDWAFTTLSPSIGTVVLDNYQGRPTVRPTSDDKDPRTSFTIADIPGLIEDAHLDRGLGLGFLRHIERARILAFVVDLSAGGDSVAALQNLWKEMGEYETLRNKELNEETEQRMVAWKSFGSRPTTSIPKQHGEGEAGMVIHPDPARELEPLKLPPISSKPWFVVATKADQADTQDNFAHLQTYVRGVESGELTHPSGRQHGWRRRIAAIPVSALRSEGVNKIPEWVAVLLDSS